MENKEFNLSEKRKELYYEMKEPLTTEEEEMLLIAVFDFIEKQDKEFIKRLKENLFWALKNKAHYYCFKEGEYKIRREESIIDLADENINDFIKEWVKIDELTGEKLI